MNKLRKISAPMKIGLRNESNDVPTLGKSMSCHPELLQTLFSLGKFKDYTGGSSSTLKDAKERKNKVLLLPVKSPLHMAPIISEDILAGSKRKRSCDFSASFASLKRLMNASESCEIADLHQYLIGKIASRSYVTNDVVSLNSCYASKPTEKQINDYDLNLVKAVRNGDMEALKEFHDEGRSLTACNKFGESIVHMAARSGNLDVFYFILSCTDYRGIEVMDDYGRMPLHDACWSSKPCFEIVWTILEYDKDMIFMLDKRGSPPLSYVNKSHRNEWRLFLDLALDRFWPALERSEYPRTAHK